MPRYGLLIDYDYCTGCHTCEVACQQEHNFPAGKTGIIVTEHVYQSHDRVRVDHQPFVTALCDLCAKRVRAGEPPACVKHCQSQCMQYGSVAALARAMEERPKQMLVTPG